MADINLKDILSKAGSGPVTASKGKKEGIVLDPRDVMRYTKNV